MENKTNALTIEKVVPAICVKVGIHDFAEHWKAQNNRTYQFEILMEMGMFENKMATYSWDSNSRDQLFEGSKPSTGQLCIITIKTNHSEFISKPAEAIRARVMTHKDHDLIDIKYLKKVKQKIKISKNLQIFDLLFRNGVYPISLEKTMVRYNQLEELVLKGSDYSDSFITDAKRALKNYRIELLETEYEKANGDRDWSYFASIVISSRIPELIQGIKDEYFVQLFPEFSSTLAYYDDSNDRVGNLWAHDLMKWCKEELNCYNSQTLKNKLQAIQEAIIELVMLCYNPKRHLHYLKEMKRSVISDIILSEK